MQRKLVKHTNIQKQYYCKTLLFSKTNYPVGSNLNRDQNWSYSFEEMLLKKREFNSKLHCACGRPSSCCPKKKNRRFGPAQRHSALSTLLGRPRPSFSALRAWPSEPPWALSPNRPSSARSECPWPSDESDGHPSFPLEQKTKASAGSPKP